FFFFQAEDGIRDFHVTGVQTCALPIYAVGQRELAGALGPGVVEHLDARAGAGVEAGDVAVRLDPGDPGAGEHQRRLAAVGVAERSEERRVGKARRAQWSTNARRKTNNE